MSPCGLQSELLWTGELASVHAQQQWLVRSVS